MPETLPADRSASDPWMPATPPALEQAILQTVAYADIFDYPLTGPEIHHYLVATRASLPMVQEAVNNGLLAKQRLILHTGYLTLPGREAIVETRLRREGLSTELWHKGERYGLAIAALPFVRLVAVTGTLAVNNVEQGADIDYLIVTLPGRVWLTRLLCVALVRLGRLGGVEICPNLVISTDALAQFEHSFFTAHELAQMIPLYGMQTYRQLLSANDWACRFLPNAFDANPEPADHLLGPLARLFKRCGEWILAGRLGDALERMEERHKIDRLRRQAESCGTCAAVFTPDQCKGHMDDHGQSIREAYVQRLLQIGLDAGRDTSLLRSA